MSIAGMTTTELNGLPAEALPVVGELQGNRDVVCFAQRLDHELERVFVFADDTKLLALDARLHFGGDVLDPFAQVTGDLLCDACVEAHLDLASTLADGLRVTRLEQLGRKLPPCRLFAQNLERRLRPFFTRGLDLDHVATMVVSGLRVLEVVARADLAAGPVSYTHLRA